MTKNFWISLIFVLALPIYSQALTTKIVNINGIPRLTMNGKPITPVMFNVNVDSVTVDTFWSELSLAVDNGVNIISFPVDLPWAKEENVANFSEVDKLFAEIIQRYPQVLLIPRFSVSDVPTWWIRENPDEMMVYDNGQKGMVSVASDKWRNDAQEMVRIFVRRLESLFGEHILGYQICAQNTGEWFYDRVWDNVLPSFEPPMLNLFRQWLRTKYADNPTLLQLAWNDNRVQFQKITLPPADKRLQTISGLLRDPITDQRIIDFFDFQQDIMAETIEQFAHEVKKVTKRQKLVLCYYGYSLEFAALSYGPQISGHLALSRILRNKDIDIICSPLSYSDRDAGGMASVMSTVDSIQLSGKLWLMEDDTRTHLADLNEPFKHTSNLTTTQVLHQRNFGHLILRNGLCSWTDLRGRGWLNDKEIWTNLSKLKNLYHQYLQKPILYNPEIAVIVDEKSLIYLSAESTISMPLISEIRQQLAGIGTSVGYYLLNDLIEGKVNNAKLYIFLNAFRITQQQQNDIKNVLGNSKTAIWFYAPGFFDEREGVVENITKLTGFKTERISTPVMAKVFPITDKERGQLVLPLKEWFGIDKKIMPVFAVLPDKNIYPLAYYEDTEKVAVAMKSLFRWTSIFVGIPTVSVDFLRTVAKYAGVHLYSDTNDLFETNDKIIFIHARTDGNKRIRFKAPCVVCDGLTNELLSSGRMVNDIEFWLDKGQTKILLLK